MLKYLKYIFIFYSQVIYAQHETDTRVVGYQGLMTFDNNNQVQLIQTNTPLYNPITEQASYFRKTLSPNSICDTMGKLLFYYEGANLYRADGSLMKGGNLHTLNLSSYYTSSLIVPIEESNRRFYYLFEVIPYEENWEAYQTLFNSTKDMPNLEERSKLLQPFWDSCKMVYHIIDMKLEGGEGAVIKKNIHIYDGLAPTISGIKHADNIATWISVFKYKSDQLINFKFNSCGIVDTIVNIVKDYDGALFFSYQSFQNSGLQIVFSPKGDNVSFSGYQKSINYNNNTGVFKQSLFILPFNNKYGTIDNSDLKTIEVMSRLNSNLFSTDSKYLYYNDSEFSKSIWTYQYDLNSNVSIPVLYNREIDRNLGIDYGKNNDILILKWKYTDPINIYLGQIKNIDDEFILSNLVDNLDKNQIKSLYIFIESYSRNNYIYNFYHPDYKKPEYFQQATSVIDAIESPVCYNQSISLKAHSTVPADSSFWIIQNETSNEMNKIYASEIIHHAGPGKYKTFFISYKNCLSDTASKELIVENFPIIPTMDDTLYTCENKTLALPQSSANLYWTNQNQDPVYGMATTVGSYTAHLKNSCAHITDSLYVENSTFDLNNLITPNADLKNDCLYLTTNHINETFRLEVFNRWGSKVFEQNNLNMQWCPTQFSDGIYYYQILYNQKDCIYNGWVEVVH